MIRSTIAALAVGLVATGAAQAGADLVKKITIAPGKGVSFYIGSQQGTAIFTPESGACGLKIAIAQKPVADGMSGMSGGMAGTAGLTPALINIQVVPARPTVLSTPGGEQLVFNCGPDGQQMFLDMPTDFKYSEK